MRFCIKQLLALLVLTVAASPAAAQTDTSDSPCVSVYPNAVALTSDGVIGSQVGSSGEPGERFSFSRFTAINRTDRCFGASTIRRLRDTCVNFLAETELLPLLPVQGEPTTVASCTSEKSSIAKLAKRNRQLRRKIKRLQGQ